MNLRWLKIIATGLLALVILLVVAVLVVTRTEAGAGWVLGVAQDKLDGLEIGHHNGSIHGGLELKEVSFTTPAFALSTDSLDVAVRTDWFPFVLRVEWLEAGGLVYEMRDAGVDSDEESLPDSIKIPVPVELPRIQLSDIRLLDGEGSELFAVKNFNAAASVNREVQLHELELVAEEGTVNLAGTVALQNPFPTEFTSGAVLEVPVGEEPEPLAVEVVINGYGNISGLDLEISGRADPPGFGMHSFITESHITRAAMETARFEITGPDLKAIGSGLADWEKSWVRLDNVSIEIPGSHFKASAQLAAGFDGGDLDGEVAWTGFSWPLRAEVPEWVSPEGSVVLSGSIDHWSVTGQVEAQATGYPAGQARFEANGDRGGLRATIPEMTILGGSLRGAGSYRWDDGGAFSAEIGLEELSTESIAPNYPAVLSGELAVSGQVEPLGVSLDIQSLNGEVLGRPVAAAGRIEVADDQITADEFTIVSGASRVVLNGYPDEHNGLAFSADISNLGDFLPDSRGSFVATGSLNLRSGWPVLNLEANATEIGWQDYQVSSLTVSGGNLNSTGSGNSLDISLLGTRVGETVLDRADVRLVLEAESQVLSVNVLSGLNELSLELAGTAEQRGESLETWSWSGHLENLQAVLNGKDKISLQEPAVVLASAKSARLDTACLLGSRGATICLEAGWNVAAGAEFEARVGQVPLDVLNELLGMDLRLSQVLSGDVQMRFPSGKKPSGSADFHITAGAVSYVDDPDPILETGEGALAFVLSDGRLTSGVLDIPITGQGVIDIDYQIPDVTEGLDAELVGTLLIDLADLDLLTIVFPTVDRVSGTLRADLAMSGTLGQPYFRGRLDLRDGLLMNRASGLKLEDIELSGNLVGNGETQLTGGFRAAEGAGDLTAQIDLRDIQRPQFELGVNGEQLTLFDSEDLMIVIDTDLSLVLVPGSVTIDGAVHVPRALIAPAVIPEQIVNESTDLVITAGRPTGEIVEEEEAQPLSILGDLKFSLGDDVTLDLTVAELDLTGEVDFKWQGDPLPIANGTLSLEGEVVAFGQRLEIAQGDIRFPDGPADNPHLNIRAEREIFGNSEVRRAGLLVAGTVSRPVIEPYTDPMTNRDRAQTLLVTGSDFNMERGVGAVDIGTYIAPRIFLSYGVGVFDDSNILSIRYDLGRGWGVKATSGERQTGIDMSYTIER